MIINGNSLDELKKLDENSIDSVVTDPPYGLNFMGKKWDYDVPSTELWAEVFRVLKPGGHLLAFAGTRTQHRMAVNIEDAGFEIRDMIAWVYGSGFPKSLNIGKAVDKLQGNERDVVSIRTDGVGKTNDGGILRVNKLSANEKGMQSEYEYTKGNSKYEGWGTALKPALEPITVARKPIKGIVANNVLEWGTGGINIDGCRVEYDEISAKRNNKGDTRKPHKNAVWKDSNHKERRDVFNATGRFPANFIHDGSDEVMGLFPNSKSTGGDGYKNSMFCGGKKTGGHGLGDDGSAARFFYCAKASKSERNKGLEGFKEIIANDGRDESLDSARMPHNRSNNPKANFHPTVKPVKLMQYLVRLVTPKGGTVLDPFNGSGTTGIACKLEGMEYIGIELDQEYCKISLARIMAWQPDKQEQLDV